MVILLTLSLAVYSGARTFPGAAWETKTPAELGLDGAKLDTLAANIGGNGIIIREGYAVKTWGNQTSKADWASAAKPVISTLLFFAIKEGIVSNVNARITNYNWALSTKDQPMEFRHLANMTSGYARGEAPGAAWAYNDYAISLYAKTLFDRAYGTTANAAALDTNRLGALGLQDGSLFSSRGGYGVTTSVRDFARIGWLWCNKGFWNGVQLLPQQFFDDYMKAQVSGSLPRTAVAGSDYLGVGTYGGGSDQTADGPGVYGYNWWCNPNQSNWPDAPSDTVQANGHWGLEVVTVIPSLGVVLATYGGNMGSHTTGSSSSTMSQNLKLLTEACPPLAGYLIVDPTTPARMVYSNTYENGRLKPVFFSGPGDPEDLLWVNSQNNVNFLISKGARCTYITAVLQDFGGPYSPGTGAALDTKLTEWENYISQMENAGIITVFFFFDDSQGLPANWQELVDKCVAKFKHHKLLIWSVAEEYGEALTPSQVSQVAARIKSQDNYSHVVGVHQNAGNSFNFVSDPNLDLFLMQLNNFTPGDLHNAVKTSNANGSKILNLAEAEDHAKKDRTTVRQLNWAAAMGGASAAQVLWMGRATDDPTWNDQGKYDDCARLMDFMQGATLLNTMTSRDDLAHGATQWVLANPGQAYIAYTTNAGAMGLKSMTTGNYYFRWLDIPGGAIVQQTNVAVSAGDQSWARPPGIGNEAAVYVVNDSSAPPNGAAINVLGNGVTIANGDSVPSTGDHTDFGSVDLAGGSVTRVYTIQNNGTLALTVSNVTLSGSSDFTLTASPASSVAPGGSTTFNVTFDPSATGVRTATVSINNNTTNGNPYTFAIQGAGVSTSGSLVGHWQFEEGSGTSTADASGYGANGTLESGSYVPTWKAGKVGSYSLEFNTANSATDANISRVDVGNPSQFGFATAMTLAAWVYLDAANTSAGSIASKMGASGLRGWRFGNDNTAQAWELSIAPSSTSVLTYRAANGSATPAVGKWTHVAGVYDGANQTMALYINGVAIPGSVVSGTIPSVMNSPAVNVALGGRANDFSQKWDGKLDDVRIYSTAESAAAIWGVVQPYAQYQSRASGNWHAVGSWTVRLDSSQSYVAATTTDQLPTSATVQGITLLNGHTLTVAAPVSLDQVTVNAGGQITVSSGQILTLDDGAGTDLIVNGTLSFNGTGKIAGAGSVSINSGGALVISDPNGIASSGAGGNIQNTGTRTYSTGANYTYAGTANQAAGSGLPATVNNLTINNTGNTIALANGVAVNGTLTLTAGVLNANGNDVAADKLSGLGTLNNTGTSSTLTVGGSGGSSAFGGVVSGALTLNKTGVGALTLSNASTYSGDTSVSGGTLALSGSGSLANTPVISLAAGATLSIAGIALAGYAITGAGPQQTLACSHSAGTANVDASGNSLELALGALARFKADGTSGTVGKLSVTGDLTLNANAITVEVVNGALGGGSYRLLECSGTLANSGVFGAPAITGLGLVSGKGASLKVVTGAAGYVELQVTTPAPVFLPPVLSSGQLILSWTGLGQLESAPEVTGPWTPVVPAPLPPYAVEVMTSGNQFFRLVSEP